MCNISNGGFISLVRGDSFEAPLFINEGTREVPVRFEIVKHPEASVYLGIMEYHQNFEDALIRKYYDGQDCKKDFDDKTYNIVNKEGDIVVKLKPTDTEYLLPCKYYYEVKVDRGDGRINTIIPKTEFFILS